MRKNARKMSLGSVVPPVRIAPTRRASSDRSRMQTPTVPLPSVSPDKEEG